MRPSPAVPPIPTDPSTISSFGGIPKLGPTLMNNTGHTEWGEGTAQQTGFTTTFKPNSIVPYNNGGQTYDIDFNNMTEGGSTTAPTFAAVTSRSYHVDVVNVVVLGRLGPHGAKQRRSESLASAIDSRRHRHAADEFLSRRP